MMDLNAGGVVLIADRMPLRRVLLQQFLARWASANDLTIVASDFSDVAALHEVPNCRLVILSIGSESLAEPRLASTRRVASAMYPDAPLVLIGEFPDPERVEAAIQMGSSAYIPFELEADLALAALSFVLAGGSYFPTVALKTMSAAGPPPREPARRRLSISRDEGVEIRPTHGDNGAPPSDGVRRQQTSRPDEPPVAPGAPGAEDLTARQRQVLTCLKNGYSNKQIARELDTSEATVKVHVRQVMKKLGASNRTQAVVMSLDGGARRPAPEPSIPIMVRTPPWGGALHA